MLCFKFELILIDIFQVIAKLIIITNNNNNNYYYYLPLDLSQSQNNYHRDDISS